MAVLLLMACAGEEGRVLRVAERIDVPEEATTLAIDSAGRIWMGAPGSVWIRDTTGLGSAVKLTTSIPARAIGWGRAGTYLRAGDSLYLLPPGSDTLGARRGDFGDNVVRLDVRARALYQGARSGAVLGHDIASLEPLWAWAALGQPTTAIALSPYGDRLYQALGRDDEPRLLIRDLQTGRILGGTDLQDPLEDLVAAPSGDLYGLAIAGSRATVIAYRPRREELVELWRRGIPRDEAAAPAKLGVSAERVFVWGGGEGDAGIRVFSTADGTPSGRTRESPRDAAFGPDGALWALFPGEVQRLE